MKSGSSYINTGACQLGRGQLEGDSFDDLRGVLALPPSNVVYRDVYLEKVAPRPPRSNITAESTASDTTDDAVTGSSPK
jgi:hypothetical protein